MVDEKDDAAIKIADFGFAKKITKPLCLRTLCGTAQYVAPEVLVRFSSFGFTLSALLAFALSRLLVGPTKRWL